MVFYAYILPSMKGANNVVEALPIWFWNFR